MTISPPLQWAVASACLLLAGCPLASAQITSFAGTQHFNDGDKLGTGTYLAAVSGQAAPFDHFIGSDAIGPNFDAQWTMLFTTPTVVNSATITLGIYDHDSKASANPVSLFTAGGADLTSTLNAAMTAHGGANGEYDVYTVDLPSSAYAALLTGSAGFQLTLNGPGSSVLGNTTYNGAGLDFAKLYIAVPEPATEAWFGVTALLGLAFVHRNRRRSR